MTAVNINIICVEGLLLAPLGALYIIYAVTRPCAILIGSDKVLQKKTVSKACITNQTKSKPDPPTIHDLSQSTIIIKKKIVPHCDDPSLLANQ